MTNVVGGRSIRTVKHKTFNESEKRKRRILNYSEARAKKMTLGLIMTDVYLTLTVVPGALRSPLRVNSLNPCNDPMRWVLFLLSFTEEETGTKKLRS